MPPQCQISHQMANPKGSSLLSVRCSILYSACSRDSKAVLAYACMRICVCVRVRLSAFCIPTLYLSLSLSLSLSHGFLPPWPGFMLKMPQCCNYRNFVRVVSLVCALRMAPKKMPHKTREMLFNRGAYKYKITCMIHVCTYREREYNIIQ